MIAIQDTYPAKFAHCYGCGPDNPFGLHLKSYVEGDGTIAHYTPDARFTGGYPGNVYGGLIAALLDCHGTASAAAFALRATGRTVGDGGDPIRFVTANLTLDFHYPTPMGTELILRGRLLDMGERKARVALGLSADDRVCVSATMVAVSLRKD